RDPAAAAERPLVRARQFSDFHRSASLEHWIAGQQGPRLLEARSPDPDVAGQVPRHRDRRTALRRADTVADGAAAVKKTALLQLADIGRPRIIVGDGVVVHEKDVLGHVDLLTTPSIIARLTL